MKRAMATYEKKYGYRVTKPIQVEVYPKEGDFAVRVMGLPGVGLLGVTFDTCCRDDGPSSRAKQEGYHWAKRIVARTQPRLFDFHDERACARWFQRVFRYTKSRPRYRLG